MENIKGIFEELKGLMGKTDSASIRRRDEISLWLKENKDNAEVQALYDEFMNDGLAGIELEVENLRQQIGAAYSFLPMAYIARKYFGKSASWLAQRVNGNPVRGVVYTLNTEQKAIFNSAVQDIAKQIGAVSLV